MIVLLLVIIAVLVLFLFLQGSAVTRYRNELARSQFALESISRSCHYQKELAERWYDRYQQLLSERSDDEG